MGPKPAAKAGAAEGVEGEDPAAFLQNYQKFCKTIGLPANSGVAKNLNDEEKWPVKQIIIDDEFGPLGPGGTRALMTALMGSGPGMKGGPYKLLECVRIWRSNAGDEGVMAIAQVLQLGGAEVKLNFLELLDNNIGPRGCMALGHALAKGGNVSLLTLNLDYNGLIGTAGVQNLARGLRSNFSLRNLSMQYCRIDSEAGPAIADVLNNAKSALETITLNGNRLGGIGLAAICVGLATNQCLQKLSIADNMIDQTEQDLAGLTELRTLLLNGVTKIASVDLLYNRIGGPGAEVLLPIVEGETANKNVSEFLIDLTVPMPLFDKLYKAGGGKKGGKGKKGKKKK